MSDMTRSEAISVIELIMRKYEEDECICCDIMLGDEDYEALRLARDSLKADEAYQLEYESTTKDDSPKYCDRSICLKNEYNNIGCDDCKVTKSQEPTTKNDLGVDAVSRKAVHDMLENLPVTVEDKWFNWLQKACMRLAELPSVTPQEPKTGYISIDDVMSVFDDFMCGEVDEDGTETFLEMLKDKAKNEG